MVPEGEHAAEIDGEAWINSCEPYASSDAFRKSSRRCLPGDRRWGDSLDGNPVRARRALQERVIGRIVIAPLPEAHGSHCEGELDRVAVLEGQHRYHWCRRNEPRMEQWITSPAGRRWSVTSTLGVQNLTRGRQCALERGDPAA